MNDVELVGKEKQNTDWSLGSSRGPEPKSLDPSLGVSADCNVGAHSIECGLGYTMQW